MPGMITTGNTSISGYGSRTIAIEVTGVCCQDVMRTSNYTINVPYSRMSQTIQNINRMGGKVANISLRETAVTITTPPSAQKETNESSEPEPKRRSGGKKNRSRK
jgi:phycocyanin-associated, rod